LDLATKASASPNNLPDVLAQEIVEDSEGALEQFREIASDLSEESVKLKRDLGSGTAP
jgi:hypothetical protein